MESLYSCATAPTASSTKNWPFLSAPASRSAGNASSNSLNTTDPATSPHAKCIYCGSHNHSPHQCTLTDNRFLSCKSVADKIWKITATGLQLCFGFNRANSFRATAACNYKHFCSCCGMDSHNAQSCPRK
jgi:hypothetical protein